MLYHTDGQTQNMEVVYRREEQRVAIHQRVSVWYIKRGNKGKNKGQTRNEERATIEGNGDTSMQHRKSTKDNMQQEHYQPIASPIHSIIHPRDQAPPIH